MHTALPPTARKPLGLAFDIPDLLLARAVAEARGLRIVVEIDHHTDSEELEEVLAWYPAHGNACRCLIWRSASAAVVQPIPGRARRFPSLADALEWLAPETSETLHDNAGLLEQRRSAATATTPDGSEWGWHATWL